MLNHYAVSALCSEPRGGRTWFIQNELCNQQHLEENCAKAIVFDIPPAAENANSLTTQLIETLNKEVKDPVFMDISFKNDGSLWFAAKRVQIRHKDSKRIYLILDSFENLFTYSEETQRQFCDSLTTLTDNQIPQEISETLNKMLMGETDNPLSGDAVTTMYSSFNYGIMLSIEKSLMPNVAALAPAFGDIISHNAEMPASNNSQEGNPYQLAISKLDIPGEQAKISAFIQSEMLINGANPLPAFRDSAIHRHGINPRSLDILTQNNVLKRRVSPSGNVYYTPAYQNFAADFNQTAKHKTALPIINKNLSTKTLAVICAAIGFIVLLAFSFRNSEYGSTLARSNMLSSFAFQKLEKDPTFSLRLAQKAIELDSTNQQAYSALLNSFYNTDIFYNISTLLTDSAGPAFVTNDCQYILALEKDYDKDYYGLRVETINGEQIALIPHPAEITSASMSPCGKYIITTSEDSIARIFTINGDEIKSITGHHAFLHHAAFSPDCEKIATAGGDGNVMIWDTTGNNLATIEALDGDVYYTSFSADGKRIVIAGDDIAAKIYTPEGNLITTLEIREDPRFAISVFLTAVFSPDGRYILTSSIDRLNKNHKAKLWDSYGNELVEYTGHNDLLNSAFFSTDGSSVITASNDDVVRVYSLSGDLKKILKGHRGNVYSAQIAPDGQTIVTVGGDKTVRTWDIAQRFETYPDAEGISFACFSPDCMNLAVVKDTVAYLWDLTGEKAAEYSGHTKDVNTARFSHNGKYVATSSDDGTVKLWEKGGKLVKTFTSHTKKVNDAVFSPDDNYLVSVSNDSTVVINNLTTGESIRTKGHNGEVTSIAFEPKGNTFVTGGSDRKVITNNIKGDIIHIFSGHNGKINSVAFSSDGEHIVSASEDKTAVLWDINGDIKHIFRGYENTVNSAGFSPEGRYIVTTSDDGVASIWTADGKDIIKFKEEGKAQSAAFSPDGKYLLAIHSNTSGQRTIKVRLLSAGDINRHIDKLELYGTVWAPDHESAERYGM